MDIETEERTGGMITLLGNNGGAVFSSDMIYRYSLWRNLGDPLFRTGGVPRSLAFIGLNPSTADQSDNDATIARCVNRATALGFGRLYMLNLFGLRSKDPQALYNHDEPIGEPENDTIIRDTIEECEVVVCAWGFHGRKVRVDEVLKLVPPEKRRCLGRTQDGHPRHPLYVPNAKALEQF